MMRRVIILEPSVLVQAGLRTALDFGRHWEIVGAYGDLQRLDERLATSRAELVVINPLLVEFHRRHQLRGLFPEDLAVVGISYGGMGSVGGEEFDGMIDIFEPLCRVEQRLTDALSQKESSHETESAPTDQNDLSEREKEILVALLKGLTNKEIALAYNISIHTVISHRKNITRKTGIKSLSGLTVYALLNNLIEQQDI